MNTDRSTRIGLVTYSTKPRGGVVHTLSLAEALYDAGADITVITLGDPAVGFYRPTRVPTIVVPAPALKPTLEKRIFASIDALEVGLGAVADQFDVLHTQDCISARAAARVRDAGADVAVLRTVHHVDDFTTEVLINCQIQAIQEPDQVFVVSEQWRAILREEHAVDAEIVSNGVDAGRFAPITAQRRTELRRRAGIEPDDVDRTLLLSVGGIEPRKGSIYLIQALAELKASVQPSPVLAVIGDHSFQDYQQYRDSCLELMTELGLEIGRDVILLGTVSDAELPEWYRAADVLAFPSTKEGWGLAVLEAMAAHLPVVTSDLPVFAEYLTDGVDALMSPVGDVSALAQTLARLCSSPQLRAQLAAQGQSVVDQYSWQRSAQRHLDLYAPYAQGSVHSIVG